MRGVIEGNVNLSWIERGEQQRVELDERMLNRAAKGLIKIVSSEAVGVEEFDHIDTPDLEVVADDGQGEGDDEDRPGWDEGPVSWPDR